MCGVTGVWTSRSEFPIDDLDRMTAALQHRGPDDCGIWIDRDPGLGLGHRRLAILDLSAEGRQPMVSPDGRYVVVFNGEIYNFRQLRRQLEPVRWRGTSDTEVLLAALERWGVERSVPLLTGMFAFAVWDRREEALHLVRDRLGIKPLYYGWANGDLLFGSELSALLRYEQLDASVNMGAAEWMLRHRYIPAPMTILEGVHKQEPGTILTFRGRNLASTTTYWSLGEADREGRRVPFAGSFEDAVEELESELRRSVAERLVADVPVGAFLSGGVDSSTVAALMQELSAGPVNTYSVGFAEDGFDEAPHAAAVARHLGTEHHELLVTEQDALDVIPRLAHTYDEPFGDPSQIPTVLLSRFTREGVKVSLSGDGGDELFAGYRRYHLYPPRWQRLARLPLIARRLAAAGVRGVSGEASGRGGRIDRLTSYLGARDLAHFSDVANSAWRGASVLRNGNGDPSHSFRKRDSEHGSDMRRLMYRDAAEYLPDDILVKVDRASMSFGLEARLPLLDHRVVELAWKIPERHNLRHPEGKAVLRQVLYRHVPKELVERPKHGFSVPIGQWLRKGLRPWAEELLAPRRVEAFGVLDSTAVSRVWRRHLAGEPRLSNFIWNLLMLQAWLEHNQSAKCYPPDKASVN